MKSLHSVLHERQVVITLETIVHALMASKSISEIKASRKSFSRILGPRVAELISAGSKGLIAAVTKAITTLFIQEDYHDYVQINHRGN